MPPLLAVAALFCFGSHCGGYVHGIYDSKGRQEPSAVVAPADTACAHLRHDIQSELVRFPDLPCSVPGHLCHLFG